jgi:hypothetical protein
MQSISIVIMDSDLLQLIQLLTHPPRVKVIYQPSQFNPHPAKMSSMDVDPIEEVEMTYHGVSQNEASSSRTQGVILVDDAHPFDLDTYISGYSGKPLW